MTPGWAAPLPLVYASSLAEKRYATQWTRYLGERDGGLHELELLLELDPVALGMGGSLVRQRSRLFCTAGFDPVHYAADVLGTRLELRFAGDSVEATLPDGSRQVIPRAGAAFVVDGNLPGLTALIYLALRERGLLDREASLRLFLSDQLVSVPYTNTPAGAGRHHSSHRSELQLDGRGVLLEAVVPARAVRTWLEPDPPPFPAWPESLAIDVPPLRYQPPPDATFRFEDVIMDGPVTPIGATMTIPAGDGPFPAVLFLGGSGTHDRHGIAGEIDTGAHEIVDHLSAHGFAGLRFDTRGAGTTGMGADTLDRGLEADVADARACLAWLRGRGGTSKLFLIGHSQGATIALVLAAEHDVDGIVLLAPVGRPFHELAADQIQSHGRTIGLNDDQIARQIADVREAVELARSDRPWQEGEIPDYILGMLRTPTWVRQFLAHEPAKLIAKLRCPVLICQGGKDFQVSPERDAEMLVETARAAGIACEYAFFPPLDHLFKPVEGESTLASYYDRTRRVDASLLAKLEEWLGRVTAA